MLSIGRSTACYIIDNGTVKCWGRNVEGQAGDPSLNNVTRGNEIAVSGINNAVAVSTGTYHACALISTGEVKCWGSQAGGTLGNGVDNSNKVTTPVTVSGITNAVDLEVSRFGGCVITTDRMVKCWGNNSKGEVGDGTTTKRTTPVSVSVSNPIRLVAIDFMTTCVVADGATSATADNELWCWGGNMNGLITTGGTTDVVSPTRIMADATSPLLGVIAASSNGVSNCAVLDDGSVWCWGTNNAGRLANGSPNPGIVTYPGKAMIDASTPITGAVAISAVQSATCVMTINAGAKAQRCWGVPGSGAGVILNSTYADAIPVVAAANVDHISAAESSASPNGIGTYWCAIMTDKKLVCGNDTGSTVSPTLSAASLANPAPWLTRPTTPTIAPTTIAPTTTVETAVSATPTTTAAATTTSTANAVNITATKKKASTGTSPAALPTTGSSLEWQLVLAVSAVVIGIGTRNTTRRRRKNV